MNDLPLQTLKLFPIGSRPYGLTYEEWSIKWWSWFLKIPKKRNPAYDVTGSNAYMNQQSAKVFFLCQTFEDNGAKPTRKIVIKKWKSLYFPLINWISVAPQDGRNDDDLMSRANVKMDSVKNLTITVNGSQITEDLCEYRVQSRPFHVELPEENILKLSAGKKRVVSDGYWILTKPITDSFKLSTFGSCTSGLTKISVNYEITVQ